MPAAADHLQRGVRDQSSENPAVDERDDRIVVTREDER
jgi:hypothetical protein